MGDYTQIQLRRATRPDATSIWHVRTRAIEVISRSYYDQQKLTRWASAAMPSAFEDAIVRMDVVVAERTGRIVGWGHFDGNASHVEALFVDPDSQGRGVGSRILATIEDIARSAGVRSLRLSSALNAVAFYEHRGFERRSQTIYHHPDGFDLDCVAMVKQLDASLPLRKLFARATGRNYHRGR